MGTKRKIKASDEIQGRCTKCRKTTLHKVVAVLEGEIKKVHCQVCDSTHRYYPPAEKAPSKKPAPRPKAAPAPKVTEEERSRQAASTEWRNTVEGVNPDKFKPYQLNGVYAEKDFLQHPQFGPGQVRSILGAGKMEVLFADGARRLVFNRKY